MNNICAFQNCGAELPTDSKFTFCERCRIIDNRNRIALVTDPHSPLPSAYRGHVQALITQMTGEEMVRMIEDWEKVYLEFCKMRKLYAPEGQKRVKLTLVEEVEETRRAVVKQDIKATLAKKVAKKGLTVIEKQMNLMGCSDICRASVREVPVLDDIGEPMLDARGEPRVTYVGTCKHGKEAKRIFNDDFGDL